jgi:hypothetical protein
MRDIPVYALLYLVVLSLVRQQCLSSLLSPGDADEDITGPRAGNIRALVEGNCSWNSLIATPHELWGLRSEAHALGGAGTTYRNRQSTATTSHPSLLPCWFNTKRAR